MAIGAVKLQLVTVTAEAVGSTRIISSLLVTSGLGPVTTSQIRAGIPLRAPLMVSEEHVAANRSPAAFTGPDN